MNVLGKSQPLWASILLSLEKKAKKLDTILDSLILWHYIRICLLVKFLVIPDICLLGGWRGGNLHCSEWASFSITVDEELTIAPPPSHYLWSGFVQWRGIPGHSESRSSHFTALCLQSQCSIPYILRGIPSGIGRSQFTRAWGTADWVGPHGVVA